MTSSIGNIAQVAPYSGDMLPMVARLASGTEATPGPKNSTNLPTTPCLRSTLVMVRTRSVAVVPAGCLAGQPEADHGRQEEGEGLAEHGRLGLDAAHAPPEHAEAVDHGGVGVGADQRVAVGAAVLGGEDHPRQVLEVDLVADAHARRHDPEAVEGLLGPAQELVALDVAVVLDVDVLVVGAGPVGRLGDDGVVDDHLDGHQWVDLGRVAPQLAQRVAHGGQVDHARARR